MGAKATFDPLTRIITLTEAPTLVGGELIVELDIKVDIYSDGKEDWLATEALRRLRYPVRPVGGDERPGGALGSTFFLADDWKIQPYDAAHRLRVAGNFYSEDGTSPYLTVAGKTVFLEQELSAIVEAEQAPGSDAASIADAVWDESLAGHTTTGTTGRALTQIRSWVNSLFAVFTP